MLNVGELNKRITLQKRTRINNSFGEEINSYTDFVSVWAKVNQIQGSEVQINSKERVKRQFEIVIRYFVNITEDMRIKYKNQYLDIISIINENEENIKMIIKCEGTT